MSGIQNDIKEEITGGLQDIFHPVKMLETTKISAIEVSNQSTTETEIISSKNLSKSVKSLVESTVSHDIDHHISEITNTTKETWKVDAHNLSKIFLEQSKLSYVQDTLNGILDDCMKDIKDHSVKFSNEVEIDISPLLQPEHITEVAECISNEKPLDVRLNAFHVLLKSHFSDAIDGSGWLLLQKKLVENLCDSNIDIFLACLKAHMKLASSSSSVAIKECAMNLLDSLGRHYFLHQGDMKTTLSFQNISFYRMVQITHLLLDTFREATLNIARFGENKLDEMIDNFIQLLSVHVPQKHSRTKSVLSPLEVLSYLDPSGSWLVNLTHFVLSRQIFFSNLSKNVKFLKIIIEELINWLSEPNLPLKSSSKILQGEINVTVQKLSMFCHNLAVFSIICSYHAGFSLFPINISKKEDGFSVEGIFKMLITSMNDEQIFEMFNSTKNSRVFRAFIAQQISKLLCLKGINGSALLLTLLRSKNSCLQYTSNSIIIEIMYIISKYKHLNNPFINSEACPKRRMSIFGHNFISNSSSNSQKFCGTITKQRRDSENPGTICLTVDAECKDMLPFEIYLKQVIESIKKSNTNDLCCMIQIMTNMFQTFYKIIGISYALRFEVIQSVSGLYLNLQENLNRHNIKTNSEDITLSENCAEFLLQAALSSTGFYILHECKVVAALLFDRLQQPLISWVDPPWLLFVSKATCTYEGCLVLSAECNTIFRKDFMNLWTVLEEDCSGSQLPVDELSKHLLSVISIVSFSFNGFKAVINEYKHGSDLTFTDDNDFRPSNLYNLIQHFALSSVNCPDFTHHQFALTVLKILISNIDSCLYLQYILKYEDYILQLQTDNRVDDNSEVIIDECSLLRQRILEQTFLPGTLRMDSKPSHIALRPESTLIQNKPRSRGNGELARWLSETRLGLHDHNWLKHARKLYKSSGVDDIKGSTILDLLEQVCKVLPETRTPVKVQIIVNEVNLLPEEELGVQLIVRYGAHHRLIQPTQQNMDNLTQLLFSVKHSLNKTSTSFEGLDWFVASAYLLCSGNIEKTQSFISLVSGLPTAPLLWCNLSQPSTVAQMGSVVETIVLEEYPVLFQVLQDNGLSWWHLCCSWMAQCWWGVLDWSQICHWFVLSILHHPDHQLYFCIALLDANQDRLIKMAQGKSIYEIVMNPVEKINFNEARILIEKLHKKYHSALHSYLTPA